MDKKDDLLQQSMDKLREITSRNMRRVYDDIWGALHPGETSEQPKPDAAPKPAAKPAAKTGGLTDEALEQQLETLRILASNEAKALSDSLWDEVPSAEPAAKEAPKKGSAAPKTQKQAEQPAQAPEKQEEPPESLEDILKELHSYIGLDAIKTEVENLVNLVRVHKMRKDHGLPTVDMSLHMVFSGNPGTGKTMIARVMARIYKCLGILSKGQLIEVDRSGLVAGYVGQTAGKTTEVIEKALGGVLFIDEAYALTYHKEANDFGQEAVDTLLKAMEDHRDDLIVIVAGYDGLMDEFIKSNPGLESRFNRYLHFDDYTLQEMMAIFDLRCKQGGYVLDEDARDEVEQFIVKQNVDPITFGNARGVRNLFEQVLIAQANRIVTETDISKEKLMQLTADDVTKASEAAVVKQARETPQSDVEALREMLSELKNSAQPEIEQPDKADGEEDADETDPAAGQEGE